MQGKKCLYLYFQQGGVKLFKRILLAGKLRWEDTGVRYSGAAKAVISKIWNNIDTRNTDFSVNRDSLLTGTQVEKRGGNGSSIWLGKLYIFAPFLHVWKSPPRGTLTSFLFSVLLWGRIWTMRYNPFQYDAGRDLTKDRVERKRTHVKKELMCVRGLRMTGVLHTYIIEF